MARQPVYLDCHATTPVDRRVVDAMLPCLTEQFGNPASSTHAFGWKAQEAVETARRDVGALIGASSRDIVFTSGATESNNLALRGIAARTPVDRRHIIVSAVEHKSVLELSRWLEANGWRRTVVPVDRGGRVRLDALEAALATPTALVSVMAANNEVGTVQPLSAIAALAHQHGALLHVDAAQAVGKIPVDVVLTDVDLLSLTAHKFYGPKGCGALFVRRRLELEPLLIGGGHERGLRSGTLNVPGIVGLGVASRIARDELAEDAVRVARLRDRLLAGLQQVDGVSVNGSMSDRLPNNLHVTFAGVDGQALLVAIGDVAVSTGSACSSSTGSPSHVLKALLDPDPVPSATVRFGLGRFTTPEDVDYAVERFTAVVRHLREMAPV